jgi:hypothetical protein
MAAPTVQEVRAHHEQYPLVDNDGFDCGCVWLATDTRRGIPALVRLKVDEGQVALHNGLSFWQPLNELVWVEHTVFMPCTPEGRPLYLMEENLILREKYEGLARKTEGLVNEKVNLQHQLRVQGDVLLDATPRTQPQRFVELSHGDFINLSAVAYVNVWGEDALTIYWNHGPGDEIDCDFVGNDATKILEALRV